MARKHPRPTRPTPRDETAIIAPSAVARLKRSPPAKTVEAGAATKRPAAPPGFSDTPLGRLLTRLFCVFASLQLAIPLLALFTFCLVVATLLESSYGTAKVAQDLVYRTWWFALLLVLLSTIVLCAALKRYPWKSYQTGFLITHSGLLILLFGGLLTALGGTDGQMQMVDTDHPVVQEQTGLSRTTSTVLLPDEHELKIWQLRPPKGLHVDERHYVQAVHYMMAQGKDLRKDIWSGYWEYPLNPGSCTWHSDELIQTHPPWHLQFLQRLAAPMPEFSRRLADRTSLVVKNFYAHTESLRYSPAAKEDDDVFPALRVELRRSSAVLSDKWIGAEEHGAFELPVAVVEMMALRDPVLLPEFVDPPAPEKMGKLGQLVLVLDGRTFRLPVDREQMGKTVPLEGTGREITLTSYADNLNDPQEKVPRYPTVQFSLSAPAGKADYTCCARLPHKVDIQPAKAERVPVWYHFPDYRWGNPSLSGNLQFLQVPNGTVYYRVYGKDGLQQKGQALDPKDRQTSYPCWKIMDFWFRITDHLPSAIVKRRIVPQDRRPGFESDELLPALRCALIHGDKSSDDFLLRLRASVPEKVQVGEDVFFVQYGQHTRSVNFALTLQRAQEIKDPGTSRAASFSSDVTLTYAPKTGEKVSKDYHIWMNNPLEFDGYKFYQSNYRLLTIDPHTGTPISLSGLTVAFDPGLWFKYSGSLIVVAGIVVMFYMKAYFFKPRGQREAGVKPGVEVS